jgi:agmatine deiminase
LRAAQREFVAFCQNLLAAEGAEPLELLVADAAAESAARAALVELGTRVRYRRRAYGDIWLRDTTALFVRGPDGLGCVRFAFNGWGGKYHYPGDAELAADLCGERALPDFSCEAVLEGGALELDGEGTCLTTESCLLNPNRGDRLTRERLELQLGDALAVEKVLWLKDGLSGDHTDGHIDNLARFVAPGVVAHMRALDDDDPNCETLEAIEAELRAFRDARGRSLRLVAVPSPRIVDAQGSAMAASYLNFYIGNASVIVPSFDSEYDGPAREAIARVFPDRKTVSCSARAILEGGGGTFHCMTRQEPRGTR